MDILLFAIADSSGFIQSWWQTILGVFASTTGALYVTYLFMWYYACRARKAGWTDISFPFGIRMRADNAAEKQEALLLMMSADAFVSGSLTEAIQDLEIRAKERLLRILAKVANRWLEKHVDDNEGCRYIYESKSELSFAVLSNHIAKSVAAVGLEGYMEEKKHEVVDSVGIDLSRRPDLIAVIHEIVEAFVMRAVRVQHELCADKLSAYDIALNKFQLDASRVVCQGKINKNKGYIEMLADASSYIRDASGVIDTRCAGVKPVCRSNTCDCKSRELSGEELMERYLCATNKLAEEMQVDGPGSGVLNEDAPAQSV